MARIGVNTVIAQRFHPSHSRFNHTVIAVGAYVKRADVQRLAFPARRGKKRRKGDIGNGNQTESADEQHHSRDANQYRIGIDALGNARTNASDNSVFAAR